MTPRCRYERQLETALRHSQATALLRLRQRGKTTLARAWRHASKGFAAIG